MTPGMTVVFVGTAVGIVVGVVVQVARGALDWRVALAVALIMFPTLVGAYMTAFDPCSDSGLPFSEQYQTECWGGR